MLLVIIKNLLEKTNNVPINSLEYLKDVNITNFIQKCYNNCSDIFIKYPEIFYIYVKTEKKIYGSFTETNNIIKNSIKNAIYYTLPLNILIQQQLHIKKYCISNDVSQIILPQKQNFNNDVSQIILPQKQNFNNDVSQIILPQKRNFNNDVSQIILPQKQNFNIPINEGNKEDIFEKHIMDKDNKEDIFEKNIMDEDNKEDIFEKNQDKKENNDKYQEIIEFKDNPVNENKDQEIIAFNDNPVNENNDQEIIVYKDDSVIQIEPIKKSFNDNIKYNDNPVLVLEDIQNTLLNIENDINKI